MKKRLLIAFIPALLVLSSCSSISQTKPSMIEDTNMHEEIFGDLSQVNFQMKKLESNRSLDHLYKPVIGFQRKDGNNDTYSVRFVAAMQSGVDEAIWYRSVHNLSGEIVEGKGKKPIPVTTVYTSLNNDGHPTSAASVKAEDGTCPYDCYAVYCLLNIPNSYSNYYVDAYLSVNDNGNTANSSVGSLNVANGDDFLEYSLEGSKFIAEINGVRKESDALRDNNHYNVFSLRLADNDKVDIYHVNVNATNLTYQYNHCNDVSLGRSFPDFVVDSNKTLNVTYGGTYNVFLNSRNEFYFEKEIYFKAPDFWEEDDADAMIQLKPNGGSGTYPAFRMNSTDEEHLYNAFVDNSLYEDAQFFRQYGDNKENWTTYKGNSIKNGKDLYTRINLKGDEYNADGEWSIYNNSASIGNFTFNENELNEPQQIHTNNQKSYLNFSGDYYHITESDLSSFGANGNSDVSTPQQVTVNWNYVAPSGKSVSNFSLIYSQFEDLTDSYTIEGTSAQTISFYNPYLGNNYFKVIANLNDGSKEISSLKTFKVEDQAPRNLKVGNLPNVRDMGGRTTYAGGKIKQGLIYRGAGHNFNNKTPATSVNSEGKDVILNQLRIKTEINVANSTGNNLGNSGINTQYVQNAKMDYGATPYSNLSRNAERIRQVMDILADINNYPVFYHCRIGTDRTGITGMMIGGLLGIQFNEIMQDYCFSNFAPIDGKRYPNKSSDPNGDDCAKYIDEILLMPGKNFQEQTYNALLSIGCPASTLNTIIDIMTEGNKAEMPTTGKIGIGNSLSSNVNSSTDNEYKNPNIYYQLSNGDHVSFTTSLTAGRKDIVVYLGSQDSSSTTKLASCISLKIDNVEKPIVDKTLFLAGFGKTQQNSRTGYMFNILGDYNLSGGEHTIAITSKTNTAFYIGTICVFDIVDDA